MNLRLERLSIQADSIGASIPRFQVSVEAGQHHDILPGRSGPDVLPLRHVLTGSPKWTLRMAV
ncbi:MAG TPA: hypothetical protein VKV73_28000 [Chloroflexota bacterium]|nr:hypothetical protein [Chloroflexota bacterium]